MDNKQPGQCCHSNQRPNLTRNLNITRL